MTSDAIDHVGPAPPGVPGPAIQGSAAFLRRHGFDVSDLKSALKGLQDLRVTVIGDLIVDDYIDCDPLGVSQEDASMVVSPVAESAFVGGAGVVALHARGLGAEVRFVSVVGDDEAGDLCRRTLADKGVGIDLILDPSRPTTSKRRYRSAGKTLLKVSRLRQHPVEPLLEADLFEAVAAHLDQTDLLLFADFNYGCLPQGLVERLAALARARQVMVAADSQASSQLADISRFADMDLITPTEREARLALQDFASPLAVVSEKLRAKARPRHLMITLAENGLIASGDKDGAVASDHLPSLNTAPLDVAGAGDALFTTAAMALRSGVDFWRSAYLGAVAAACQISTIGNTPLARADLDRGLDLANGDPVIVAAHAAG